MADKTDVECPPEQHPLEPFLPEGAKVLMLGSFPPQRTRWSMDFYYPNFQNDMWRIMGVVFFGSKDRFVSSAGNSFDRDAICGFCTERGIALSDTALEVIRIKDNASDKFLDVVKATDIGALMLRLPECRAVITTGEKAAQTFAAVAGCGVPAVDESVEFRMDGRVMRLYRLPSTSRAYPKPLMQKAESYRKALSEIGIM